MQKLWTNEQFQGDVASAQTLDASWYLDPQVLEREQDAIFARTWQVVARVDEVCRPGDYLTSEAAGEPIVVTRDMTGKLRAFYNVCPHRAGVVARGKGNRKSLQCLYHGWTFNHDGQLLRAPGMDGTQGFEPSCFSLHEIRTETWGPYIFINLDDNAPTLAEMWGDEFTRVSGINFEGWKLVERCEYLVNCNWKVYMDNYAEGYHVPMAHPGLNREMNLDDYYVDTYRFFSIQWVPVKPANQGNVNKRRYINPLPEDKIRYHVMFPNFMIDEYPDNLSANIVRPQGHDKTLLTFEWYFKQDIDQEGMETMVKFADEVQYQDIEICEYVQQGLKSRAYNRGRFSARHESGVHHFQALVHEYLNNEVIPVRREATCINHV